MSRSLKDLYPDKYTEFKSSNKYKLRNNMQKEFKIAKEECLLSANNKCGLCGNIDSLDVHHIIPIENNGTNEQSNLICLCRKCHQQVHKNVYKINPDKTIVPVINEAHIIPEDKKPDYLRDFEKETGFILYKSTGSYYYFDKGIKTTIKAGNIKSMMLSGKKEELIRLKQLKKTSVKERKILEQYKVMFKETGNKAMWHQIIHVIRIWDTLTDLQKNHVFDTLHKTFDR